MSRTLAELTAAADALWSADDGPRMMISPRHEGSAVPAVPAVPSVPPLPSMPHSFLPQEADALLQQLAETDDTWAGAAALYGPGGLFDHARKSFLDVIALQIADGYAAKGEKVTQDQINRMAHADPSYITFLDQHTRDRALFLSLDQQRERVKTRLKLLTYGPYGGRT